MADVLTEPVRLADEWPVRLLPHRAEFHRDRPDWEARRLDSMHEALGPDDLLIDAGAEEGDLTALFGTWTRGRVIPVEPVPAYWPAIRATWEANDLPAPPGYFVGFAADVTLDAGAPTVLTWPDEAYDEVRPEAGFAHLNERKDIARVTLDDFARSWSTSPLPVTAITVDVEGSELRVVLGAQGLLRRARPMLWLAVHPPMMENRYGDTPADLQAVLSDLGYRGRFLGGLGGEEHWCFTPEERA